MSLASRVHVNHHIGACQTRITELIGWVQANKISPLRRWWDPELVFTGVSIMSLNPESGRNEHGAHPHPLLHVAFVNMHESSMLTVVTCLLAGKFVSHIDYWDAVSILDVSSTPCYCHLNGGHSMNGGTKCAFSASPTNKHSMRRQTSDVDVLCTD